MSIGFNNVMESEYWTSTSSAFTSADRAHAVNMLDGQNTHRLKASNIHFVWPVRVETTSSSGIWKTGQTVSYRIGDDGDLQHGITWPAPRFTNVGNNVILDNLTGVMWTKNAVTPNVGACIGNSKTWYEALDYIKCLNNSHYLGYSDWRLPNRKEIRSLADYSIGSLPANHPFTLGAGVPYWSGTYWSSTTRVFIPSQAWKIMLQGDTGYFDKTSYQDAGGTQSRSYIWVWPVRSGNIDFDRDGYEALDDCNDNDSFVNPGIHEGPYGDAICNDGKDNVRCKT